MPLNGRCTRWRGRVRWEHCTGFGCVSVAEQALALPPSYPVATQRVSPHYSTAGDEVYVVHAEQLASDDDAVESRKRLVQVRSSAGR